MNVMILTPREIQALVEEMDDAIQNTGKPPSRILKKLLDSLTNHAEDPEEYDPVAITTDIDLVM